MASSSLSTLRLAAALASLRLLRLVYRSMPGNERRWFVRRAFGDRPDATRWDLAELVGTARRHWRNPVWKWDQSRNGEVALVRRLARFSPRQVLDVGANLGDWTRAVVESCPLAHVHAFEIDPETAARLADSCAPFADRVTVNSLGLSDEEGETFIYRVELEQPEAIRWTTTVPPSAIVRSLLDRGPVSSVPATTITGDAYLAMRVIEHVDLLKIDVEGAELRVLRGFRNALQRGAVTVIQFEYNDNAPRAHALLADFHAMLEPLGYALGRLSPEGVAFKPYDIEDEDFDGPNYVAVHRSRPDIIEALRCEPPPRP